MSEKELESVKRILKRCAKRRDPELEKELLSIVRQRREFDALFEALLTFFGKFDGSQSQCFVPSCEMLTALRDEFFSSLSPLSAYEFACRLGTLLRDSIAHENSLVFACVAGLLHRLLCAIPLLSANSFREWIQTDLVEIFHEAVAVLPNVESELWRGGAALLAKCVYLTLSIEVSYHPTYADTPCLQQWEIWRRLSAAKGNTDIFSIIHVFTLLLAGMTGHNKQIAKCAKYFSNFDYTCSEEVDEYVQHLSYDYVLNDFLMWNLLGMVVNIPAMDNLRELLRVFVAHTIKFARFPEMLKWWTNMTPARYSTRGVEFQAMMLDIFRDMTNISFNDETGNASAAAELQEPSNGCAKENGIINGKRSRKRKANHFMDADESEVADVGTPADCVPLVFDVFDGLTLLFKQHSNANFELTLRDTVDSPAYVRARKHLKSLRRACAKVFQLFSTPKQSNAKASRNSQNQNIGDATLKNRRTEGLSCLLKLSAFIRSSNLPYHAIASAIQTVNAHQLSEMTTALFDKSIADQVRENSGELLYVLETFARVCGSNLKLMTLDDCRFVDFILADCYQIKKGEIQFRTNALNFIATYLSKNRGELNNFLAAPIISLCMAFCQPVSCLLRRCNAVLAHDSEESMDQSIKENDEFADRLHEFALAELSFLSMVMSKFSTIASSQSGVIMSLLPDFFQLLSLYRDNHWYAEQERIQVKLSSLCAEIKREPKAFHKAIPFAMSSWLAKEPRSTLSQPMYLLLSACDNYDLSLMSTNFRPREKHKFAAILRQFHRLNKIIG